MWRTLVQFLQDSGSIDDKSSQEELKELSHSLSNDVCSYLVYQYNIPFITNDFDSNQGAKFFVEKLQLEIYGFL